MLRASWSGAVGAADDLALAKLPQVCLSVAGSTDLDAVRSRRGPRRLSQPGLWGRGRVPLPANDLVDQLDLVTYPVVVGQGTRLFPDSGPDIALDLVHSRTTSRGTIIQTYRPHGRPEYATSTLDPKDVF